MQLQDVDDPPVATEECVEVMQDDALSIDVLANDIDPDMDEIYVSNIITGPNQGSAVIEGNGQSIYYIPNTDYCGLDTFYYQVCDIDDNGCDTAFVCIEILCDCFVPDALTPNNDGYNDYFFVDCLENIDGGELQVYNRWGNEVYRNTNYKNDWKGYYKGQPLPEGTYYYIIKYMDHYGTDIALAGDLTILR